MMLQALLPSRYRVQYNPLKTERRVELLAVALLGGVLFWLLLVLIWSVSSDGPAPLPPAQDSLAVQNLLLDDGLSGDEAAEILSRPLFWQSRRPLSPPKKVVAKRKPQAPKKLEGVVLHGVYGADDALGLIATVDGRMTRIGKGQSVKGWALETYENGVADFVSGTNKVSLALELTAPSVSVVSIAKPAQKADDSVANALEERLRQEQEGGGLTFGGGSSKRERKGDQ